LFPLNNIPSKALKKNIWRENLYMVQFEGMTLFLLKRHWNEQQLNFKRMLLQRTTYPGWNFILEKGPSKYSDFCLNFQGCSFWLLIYFSCLAIFVFTIFQLEIALFFVFEIPQIIIYYTFSYSICFLKHVKHLTPQKAIKTQKLT
jgi:hypothetical protein